MIAVEGNGWLIMRTSDHDRALRMHLSDLFLDTEVRPGMVQAAATIAESGYSRAEVDEIWRLELMPILHWNLKSVAGEWALFPIEWLEGEIEARRARLTTRMTALPLVGPMLHRLRAGWLEDQYRAVWELVTIVARRHGADRERFVSVAYEIASIYYSTQDFFTDNHIRQLRDLGATPEEFDRCFEETETILRRLLTQAGGDPRPSEIKSTLTRARTSLESI